jgi:hypothetical protein
MHSFEVSLGYESVDRSKFSMRRLQFEIKIGSSWEEVDLIPIANIAEDRKYD